MTSVAALLGVALGAWLTSRRESRTAQRSLLDQRRAERRDVYVRFLAASDRAVAQAWETGRKRTSVTPLMERQQHWLDWVAVRDDLRLRLTEISLAAPHMILERAADVVTCATEFGHQSLLAGEEGGMETPASDHQKAYNKRMAKLIAAMQIDLDYPPEGISPS